MRRLIVILVLFVSTACGSATSAPSGGIEGRVTVGPTCPVEQVGSPCPPRPWSGTVRATSSDGATSETTAASDGSYRLALAPGTYAVTPVVAGGGPPTAQPVTVTVGTAMQRLDLRLDSGIR